MKKILSLFLFFSSLVLAQNPPGSYTSTPVSININNGGGYQNVTAIPTTCNPGTTLPVNLTVAPYGIFYCSATNVWTGSATSNVLSDGDTDIRNYGAYANFSTTSCGTTAGQSTVTLGAAQFFLNGEYATCYNAGAAATVSTPATPAVTPSDHAGGMTVVNDSGGSTSYAYCVRAEDPQNGLSACSAAGSTSTGAATLGQTTQFNLSGCTRANKVVTCTSTMTHPFVVGQLIFLQNMADSSYNGNWITVNPTSGTTITFNSGWDTRNGASTSTTAGSNPNVWGFKLNRVSYTTQAAALRYHIYGPSCPTTCNWMGQSMLPYWDDYGSTMMASQTKQPYIPNLSTAPGQNQHFTFKINAGGGTTTLTANISAGVTGSSTIISDVGPAMIAAGTAANQFGRIACVTIPLTFVGGTNWQVNSYTNLSPNNVCLNINGTTLIANNTIANASKIFGLGSGSGQGNFGAEFQAVISGSAFPLLYGSTSLPTIRDMTISASSANGGLGMYLNSPIVMNWRDVYLGTGGGSSSDCIGQHFIWRSTNGAQSFSKAIENISATTGTCPVGSPVPSMVDMSTDTGNSSGDSLSNGWFLNRASFDNDSSGVCGGGIFVSLNGIAGQNATEPLLQVSGTCTTTQGGVVGGGLSEADFATPTTAIYAYGGGFWNGTFSGSAGVPNGGGNAIVGTPIASVLTSGAPPATVGSNTNGVNQIQTTLPDGYSSTSVTIQNQPFILGTGYTLFTKDTPPAAPTCSVATAGPPFTTAGTYFFSYVAFYPNGAPGQNSFPSTSSCTANGTTQQITINIPAAVPSATGGYLIYRNSASQSGGFQINMVGAGCATTTALSNIMASPSCGPSSFSTAGGGPAGITGGLVWSAALQLGSTPVASLPSASVATGQWRAVSDSTTINAEGQLCTGGGSTPAAAFSNGSIWKCF